MPIGVHPSLRTSPQHVWAASWYRPFMSTWSIWSKLCDSNALTSAGAHAILATTGPHGSVFRTHSDDRWLDHANSLSVQQRVEACCTTLFHPSAIARRILRFCPKCLESGFHCGCFQHLALTRCPVHDIELQDCCGSCGEPITPSFEVARSAVFACRNCERRLTRVGAATAAESANDPIWRSTIASLVWDGRSTPPRTRRDRTSSEAGNGSWWGGQDPFIAASTWNPQQSVVAAGGDNFNELAWKSLISQVEACSGAEAVPLLLGIVESLMRRGCLPPHLKTLESRHWASACLVAQYGGAAAFDRARRLSLAAAREEAYWLFPQVSTTVLAGATANQVIVKAELRAALASAWRLVRRLGFEALARDGMPRTESRVLWAVEELQTGQLRLQWRAPGIVRGARRMAGDVSQH